MLIHPRGLLPRGVDQTTGDEIVGLKECRTKANCFSTTFFPMLDAGIRGLEPWRFEGKSPSDAMRDVLAVVNSYQPGQQGIDGGGYEVRDTDLYYVYVQFESGRKGYIDDVEFAIMPGTPKDAREGSLLVRTSSRIGKEDCGVNALRLNALAAALRRRGGWIAPPITASSHPGYWKAANCKNEEVADRYPDYCT